MMEQHNQLLRMQRRRLLRHDVPDWTSFADMITDLRIVEQNWAAEFEELSSEADPDNYDYLQNPSYTDESDSYEDEQSDTTVYASDDDDEEFYRDNNHRMLDQLRIDMYYVSTSNEESMLNQDGDHREGSAVTSRNSKKKSKGKGSKAFLRKNNTEDKDDVNIDDINWLSKRQRKKRQQQAVLFGVYEKKEKQSVKQRRQRRQVERQIKDNETIFDFSKIPDTDIHSWGHFCGSCSAEFTTRNRLLTHLKKSGHISYIPHRAKSKKHIGQRTSKKRSNFYKRNN